MLPAARLLAGRRMVPLGRSCGKGRYRLRRVLGLDGVHEHDEEGHRPRSKGWRPPRVPNNEWAWGLASLRHSENEGRGPLRVATIYHTAQWGPLTSPLPAYICPPQVWEARNKAGEHRAWGLARSRPSMKGCFSSLHFLFRTCYSQGQVGGGEKRRQGKGGAVSAVSMQTLKPPSAFRTGTRRSRKRLKNQTLSSRMSAEPSPALSSRFNGQNAHQSRSQAARAGAPSRPGSGRKPRRP